MGRLGGFICPLTAAMVPVVSLDLLMVVLGLQLSVLGLPLVFGEGFGPPGRTTICS